MKIFRAYVVTAMVCISITLAAAYIFIADENAKKISLGEESAVVVIGSSDERLYGNTMNPLPTINKVKEYSKKFFTFAPPPIGNLYSLFEFFEAEREHS